MVIGNMRAVAGIVKDDPPAELRAARFGLNP